MAKTFITAHIKLEDELWQRLGGHAMNRDLSTAQLVRRILTEWADGKAFARVDPAGPVTLERVRLENKLVEAYKAGWWAFCNTHWQDGQPCSTPSLEKFNEFMESLDID